MIELIATGIQTALSCIVLHRLINAHVFSKSVINNAEQFPDRSLLPTVSQAEQQYKQFINALVGYVYPAVAATIALSLIIGFFLIVGTQVPADTVGWYMIALTAVNGYMIYRVFSRPTIPVSVALLSLDIAIGELSISLNNIKQKTEQLYERFEDETVRQFTDTYGSVLEQQMIREKTLLVDLRKQIVDRYG